MSHCPNRVAFVMWMASALFILSACTDPGLPWGWLEAEVKGRFDPDAGRLDEEGRLKTSGNYALELDTVEVTFDALTVVLAGAGAADFDPANPPAGYSLCHNGHCHSDSGALVDYEVIALEMAGGSAGSRVTVALDGEPWTLGTEAVSIGTTPCDPSPCELPRGELAGLDLTLASIVVTGTAFDRLTGEAMRLPPEGTAFEVRVQAPTSIVGQIAGSIGPGEPVGVTVDVGFALPVELFDDIDFSQEPSMDDDSWESLVVAALVDHGVLEVTVTRTTN